jgi:hypothetical protein
MKFRIERRKGKLILAAIGICLLTGMGFFAPDNLPEAAYLPLLMKDWPDQPYSSTHPLITEVMYDPIGDEPASEWIEIYHPGGELLDLSQFKIGDAARRGDREGMLRFPAGATMRPGQVIVIANQAAVFRVNYDRIPDFEMTPSDPLVPDMVKYGAWATHSVMLTDTGDEVLLLDNDDQAADSVSWGSSTFAFNTTLPRVPEGHSLERIPANRDRDMAEDWINQSEPTPGEVDTTWPTPTATATRTVTGTAEAVETTQTTTPSLNFTASCTPSSTNRPTASDTPMPCNPASLLISEVLYDPTNSDEPAGEWLEIYNFGDHIVNLACVKVGDEETAGGGEGMLRFPAGATLSPRGVIVVANKATTFTNSYGFKPDYEMVFSDEAVPTMVKYDSWSNGTFGLNNSGDEVLLLDGDDQVVDIVSWGNSKAAFDPPVKPVKEGHSIERYPVNQDSDSAADWRDQPLPNPGSASFDEPTPTFTPSYTATSTKTPTNTASPSPTATATCTASPSATPTVTIPTSPTTTATPILTASPSATATFTPTPSAIPLPSKLLLSEVLYYPDGGNTAGEWVEIYNSGDLTIDLTGYKIGDEETKGGIEGMAGFPGSASIGPRKVLVIAKKADTFLATYGFQPDYEWTDSDPDVPDLEYYPAWGLGSINFNDAGDEVLILNNSDQVVDLIAYGTSAYAGFQPPIPGVAAGYSIQRCPIEQDSDTKEDWIEQANPNPGSSVCGTDGTVQAGWPDTWRMTITTLPLISTRDGSSSKIGSMVGFAGCRRTRPFSR